MADWNFYYHVTGDEVQLAAPHSAPGYITVTCPHARAEYSLEEVDYII